MRKITSEPAERTAIPAAIQYQTAIACRWASIRRSRFSMAMGHFSSSSCNSGVPVTSFCRAIAHAISASGFRFFTSSAL